MDINEKLSCCDGIVFYIFKVYVIYIIILREKNFIVCV